MELSLKECKLPLLIESIQQNKYNFKHEKLESTTSNQVVCPNLYFYLKFQSEMKLKNSFCYETRYSDEINYYSENICYAKL